MADDLTALTRRLRDAGAVHACSSYSEAAEPFKMLREAADALDRLTAEIAAKDAENKELVRERNGWGDRAQAAEAENEGLRDALGEVKRLWSKIPMWNAAEVNAAMAQADRALSQSPADLLARREAEREAGA